MTPIGDMKHVRRQLIMRGYDSVEQWARMRGFLPGTVRRVVYDWGHRADEPHGGLGRQIIAALRDEMKKPPVEIAA
ncbi:MAG: hypothetical protein LDL19_11420 [Thiobacillus sp.]|nr:hypothetical protein [Thiobacillus sp.]